MTDKGMSLKVNSLLRLCVQQGGSDLHLVPNGQPLLRIDGNLRRLGEPDLSAADVGDMLLELMNEQQKKLYQKRLDVDFAHSSKGIGRFRVNAFHQYHGQAAALRFIPDQVPELSSLTANPVFERLTHCSNGIILITGPSGSGKSTTAAAMLERVNKSQSKHIITIEDPIEFIYKPKKCLFSQRGVGHEVADFQGALRSALREDPDIILVGEIRDSKTARLAMTAAETGHLVVASLHTASAAKAVDRMLDLFAEADKSTVRGLLSQSLRAVLAQKLVPKQGGGRIAVHEILISTVAVQNLVRQGRTDQLASVIETSTDLGMQTFEQHLRQLKDCQIITPEVYQRVVEETGSTARF